MSEIFSQGEIDRIIADNWHGWQEQEPVLDKIKAEIESMNFDFGDYYDHTDEIIEMVCKAIDKYKEGK